MKLGQRKEEEGEIETGGSPPFSVLLFAEKEMSPEKRKETWDLLGKRKKGKFSGSQNKVCGVGFSYIKDEYSGSRNKVSEYL